MNALIRLLITSGPAQWFAGLGVALRSAQIEIIFGSVALEPSSETRETRSGGKVTADLHDH